MRILHLSWEYPPEVYGGLGRHVRALAEEQAALGHDVAVLTQYAPHSLMDHIGLGRPWDLDRNQGGVKLLQPYLSRGRVAEWYRGTADAVLQNMRRITDHGGDTILILAGDHIYKIGRAHV